MIRDNISQNARRVKSVANMKTRPLSSNTYASTRFYRSRAKDYETDRYEIRRKTSEGDFRPGTAPLRVMQKGGKRPYSTERNGKGKVDRE